MDDLEKIRQIEKKFQEKFGGMEDEWTETFYAATNLYHYLVNCTGADELKKHLMKFIEEAPDQPKGYEEE
jgi:hypothetical protein